MSHVRQCIVDKYGFLWCAENLRYKYLTLSDVVVNGYVKISNDLPKISEVLDHFDTHIILKTTEGRILFLHENCKSGRYFDVCSEPIKQVFCNSNKIHILSSLGDVYRVNHFFHEGNFDDIKVKHIASDVSLINFYKTLMMVDTKGKITFDCSVFDEPEGFDRDGPLFPYKETPVEKASIEELYKVVCAQQLVFATGSYFHKFWSDSDTPPTILSGIPLPKPMVDICCAEILHKDRAGCPNGFFGCNAYEGLTIDNEGGLWISRSGYLNSHQGYLTQVKTDLIFKRFVCKSMWVSYDPLVEDLNGNVYSLKPYYNEEHETNVDVGDIVLFPTKLSSNEYCSGPKSAANL